MNTKYSINPRQQKVQITVGLIHMWKDYGFFSVDNGPHFRAREQTSEDLNKTMATVLNMVLTNTIVPTISDGLWGPGSEDGVPDWEPHRPASGIQAGVRRSEAHSLTPCSWRKGERVSGSEESGNPRKLLDKPHPWCRAPAQHASSTGTFPCL